MWVGCTGSSLAVLNPPIHTAARKDGVGAGVRPAPGPTLATHELPPAVPGLVAALGDADYCRGGRECDRQRVLGAPG